MVKMLLKWVFQNTAVILKQKCRFENLPIFLTSYKSKTLKISDS